MLDVENCEGGPSTRMFLLGIMEYPTLEPPVGAQIDSDLTFESNLGKDFS